VQGIAASDCERLDGDVLVQESNALSSLAFLGPAAVLAVGASRGRYRRPVLLLAALSAAEGLGSLLFHGSPGSASKWLHDVAMVGMLVFAAAWHLGRFAGAADRAAVAAAAISVVAGGALLAAVPDAVDVLVGIAVVAIVAADLVARRTRHGGVLGAPLVLTVLAGSTLWWTGRTGGPFCAPDSPLQPHAAWHVIVALAVLVWSDATFGAAVDGRARLFRDLTDRLLGLAAAVLVRGFHRSVDVIDAGRVPSSGPMLLVANHGNGFVDPVVLAAALGRLPRFLAKAALWKVVPARPLLAAAGILPVHRRADGDRSERNEETFVTCHHELGRGGRVAIFPEGTTGDRARLDRVRSGAARIALGALEQAPGLLIVPVGLAFESRVETRSRAVVTFGPPIRLGAWVREHGGDVTALTAAIGEVLAAVSPEYHTVEEREGLRDAAGIVLRTEGRLGSEPRFGEVEVLARRLAQCPAPARRRILDVLATHALRLRLSGLDDRQLRTAGPLVAARSLLVPVLVLVFAGPFVVGAALIHLPLVGLVRLATVSVRSTATKGTVRLLVGAAGALATWVVVGVLAADGWAVPLAACSAAAGGVVALLTWSRLVDGWRRLAGWLRSRDRRQLAEAALASRADLVAAVDAARSTDLVVSQTGSASRVG
jgi:glycerol-3-phosphate O-acyltransferase / dihydroxyacetone phosphate acyltransferase